MAKKITETEVKVPISAGAFSKLLNKATGAESFNKSRFTKVSDYIDTSNLALNRIISGSVFKGMPSGCICLLSGEYSTSKTLQAFMIAKNAIEKNHYDAIIYVDSEGGANRGMLDAVGIAQENVQYIPVTNIEDCTIKLITVYKTISEYQESNPNFRCLVILDSLGGLVSEKVLLDAAKDKSVSDMGGSAKKCLAPETLVLMADNTYKQIKDLKIGDTVITHLNKVKPILDIFTQKHKNYFKIKINGKIVKCSPNHKFLVKRDNNISYIRADELKITDKFLALQG